MNEQSETLHSGPFKFAGAEAQQLRERQAVDHRANALRWLSAQGQRSLYAEFGGCSPAEFEQLRQLIGHRGFGIYWSLIAHQRTEYLERLSNASLATEEGKLAAAVLQGHIKCLDQQREMLLDISDPSAQQDEGTDL